MCLKATDEGCILRDEVRQTRDEVSALDRRVDTLETKVAVINSTQNQMREEMKQGFSDLKVDLGTIYEERRKWSAWLRAALPVVGKWIAKWATIIILAAIGVNNLPGLIKALPTLWQ